MSKVSNICTSCMYFFSSIQMKKTLGGSKLSTLNQRIAVLRPGGPMSTG